MFILIILGFYSRVVMIMVANKNGVSELGFLFKKIIKSSLLVYQVQDTAAFVSCVQFLPYIEVSTMNFVRFSSVGAKPT
jgi:hypothetical protein